MTQCAPPMEFGPQRSAPPVELPKVLSSTTEPSIGKSVPLSFDLETQIDALFSELVEQPWGKPPAQRVWEPEIDPYETPDSYLIAVDLPDSQESWHVRGAPATLCSHTPILRRRANSRLHVDFSVCGS